MSYSEPLMQTIVVHANAAISTAADIFQLVSPKVGKKGRILGVSIVLTTANTGAAGALNIGTVADPDAYGIISVPVTAIDLAVPVTAAQLAAILDLPADTVILISGGGEGTGGAIDLAITIGWF
jgi:hypothetical protein